MNASDYAYVKSLSPVLWLSASNFDGDRMSYSGVVTGDASYRTIDSIGNTVTSSGTIKVVNVDGYSAYHFDKTNRIASDTYVVKPYSLLLIYKDIPPPVAYGRFFTADPEYYSFFGNWGDREDQWHESDTWISGSGNQAQTFTMQFLIAINDNGVRNMWDAKRNSQPIIGNTVTGQGIWGKTVVGLNPKYPSGSQAAYIFEAIVFNKALTATENDNLRYIFKKKYNM